MFLYLPQSRLEWTSSFLPKLSLIITGTLVTGTCRCLYYREPVLCCIHCSCYCFIYYYCDRVDLDAFIFCWFGFWQCFWWNMCVPFACRIQQIRGRSIVMRSSRAYLMERIRLGSWKLENCCSATLLRPSNCWLRCLPQDWCSHPLQSNLLWRFLLILLNVIMFL